jgi:uncharacterized SAM-binding protein YcdF (DUF218 family)
MTGQGSAAIDHAITAGYDARFMMQADEGGPSPPRATHRTRWILAALALALIVAGLLVFLGVGRWLVVQDPLEKAQAIAVLSGRMPIRALEAARLYRQGYAPEIWLTYSNEPGTTLKSMGVFYIGEETYNKQVLFHEGVPAGAIRVLDPPIENTADEMHTIAAALDQRRGGAVIIVTTKAHTRRSRTLWRKLSASHGRAIVRAASDDTFEPEHWWRNTGDALEVVREVLGILNAWAGLPLRPAP